MERSKPTPIKPIILRTNEAIQAYSDGNEIKNISCVDIAKLSLSIHQHGGAFYYRHHLETKFIRDTDGSGRQLLSISHKNIAGESQLIFSTTFSYTYNKNENCLYEHNVIKDQGKDYEPTIDIGKHWFQPSLCRIYIELKSKEIQVWQSYLERLQKSTGSLDEIAAGKFEILVVCKTGRELFSIGCKGRKTLSLDDLNHYRESGLSIEDLQTRLRCAKCGNRGPTMVIF